MARPRKPKKPKPTPKRSWSMFTENGKTKVTCYTHDDDNCDVVGLWETRKPSDFHDALIAKATKEINALLTGIQRGNKQKDRELCFIKVQGRLMLVWATHNTIGPADEDSVVSKALNLKRDGRKSKNTYESWPPMPLFDVGFACVEQGSR